MFGPKVGWSHPGAWNDPCRTGRMCRVVGWWLVNLSLRWYGLSYDCNGVAFWWFQPCYFMSIIVLCFVVCFVHVVISLQIWQSSSNQSLCVLTRWQGRINTSGAWVGTSVKMYNPVLEQILTLCQTLVFAFNEGWFGQQTKYVWLLCSILQRWNFQPLREYASVGVEEGYHQLFTPWLPNPSGD